MKSLFDDLMDNFTPPPPSARLAWWGFAIIAVLVIAVVTTLALVHKAYGQERPRVVFDCQQYASYARSLATLRDLGADRDKVIANLRKDVRPGMMLAVLERETKLVWASNAPRIEIEHGAYQRCQAQLGAMEREG